LPQVMKYASRLPLFLKPSNTNPKILYRQQDEPETQRPLSLAAFPAEIPDYYLDLCHRCLNDDPRCRSQAAALLTLFPEMAESYHSSEAPMPIVVDARHTEEGNYSNGHAPDSHYNPSAEAERSIGACDYAATDLSDSDYFPRRGRSPPAVQRRDIASDIPLPASSTGSNYLESTTRDTSAEYESGAAKLTMPSTDEHNQGLQDTEQEIMDTESISAAVEEPRNTTAAVESPIAYPEELAGVGGAHMPFSIPKANLDDDLTTDTYNDRIFLDNLTLLDTPTGG